MVDVRFCPHSERWRGLIWSGSREVAVADGLERGAARLRPVSAAVLALFLVAAAASPRINIPGVHLSHHSIVRSPEGD